jgi:hypothetical protein
MRIIGTNSARATKASQKLNEIENFISILRKKHSRLNDKYSINIVATFSCLKTSFNFPSCTSSEQETYLYNVKLLDLASILNFKVLIRC